MYREMSDIEDEEQQEDDQQQPSSDLPTSVYEVAEEQEEVERGSKRRGGGRGRRPLTSTASVKRSAATRGRQMTLADLDKHLDKQMKTMQSVADDVKHLKKQFNQVQRDLSKFEKSMEKIKKTTTAKTSTTKRGKRRG